MSQYLLQHCCSLHSEMDIDSESSCTYKDYITAYSSTRDSELWTIRHTVESELNSNLNVEKLPIMLCDDTLSEQVYSVPTIGPLHMEEMMVEPLFSVPYEYRDFIGGIVQNPRGSIPVSISSYGIKCLIFSLYGCITCIRNSDETDDIGLYIPHRFFKKIVADCESRGVECESSGPHSRQLYHRISLSDSPQSLQTILKQRQVELISTLRLRPVTELLTPSFADGFKLYRPVDVTILIMLDPGKRIKREDESGNFVVHRAKRHVRIVPLSIQEPIGHGNDVASRTSPI